MIKMPLSLEVVLGPGDIMLDEDRAIVTSGQSNLT